MKNTLYHTLLPALAAVISAAAAAEQEADTTTPSNNVSLTDVYNAPAESAQTLVAKGLQLCLSGRVVQGSQMIRQAAESGDASAMYYLGIFFLKGIGENTDLTKGIRMLEKAAEAGEPRAYRSLCRVYLMISDVQDRDKAFSYAQKAAETDHGSMYTYMAWMLLKDAPELAFRCAQLAANMENEGAGKRVLAQLYYMGAGCEKDEEKALQLFREAAEVNSSARNGLMEMLAQQKKFDELYTIATQYAYTPGSPENELAMFLLAQMHLSGSGSVEKNMDKALFWAQKGAEAGHAPSQSLLWKIYMDKGELSHMYKWLREAAMQGEPTSQAMMARAHYLGIGCDIDTEEATLWARRALRSEPTPLLNDFLADLRLKRELGDAKATDFLSTLEQLSRVYGF